MIRVLSREKMVEHYKDNPNDTTPVISIADIGFANSPVPEGHPNALILAFDDIRPYDVKHAMEHPYYIQEAMKRDLIYFDDDMAWNVIRFLQKQIFKGSEDVIIHCYAGVSRSAAIALFIDAYCPAFGEVSGVNLDDCRANSYVFGKLVKVFKREDYSFEY